MSVDCDLCGHTKSFCHCTKDLTKVLERGKIEPEFAGVFYNNYDDQVEQLLDALHDIAILAADESEWEGDAYADIRDRAVEAQREWERFEREGENQDARHC